MEKNNSIQDILDSMDFSEEGKKLFTESINLTKQSQLDSSINVSAEIKRRIKEMIANEIQKDRI